MAETAVHVAVTGLRLKAFWHWPRFGWHAVRAMAQARRAPGCLHVEARSLGGVQHTFTIWRDEAAMRAYLLAGAHGRAMRAFRAIGTGRTLSYPAPAPPTWAQAHARWQAEAREVG